MLTQGIKESNIEIFLYSSIYTQKDPLIHYYLVQKEYLFSKEKTNHRPIKEHIKAVGQDQFNICIIRILEERDNGAKEIMAENFPKLMMDTK